jgi:hypothetical protein
VISGKFRTLNIHFRGHRTNRRIIDVAPPILTPKIDSSSKWRPLPTGSSNNSGTASDYRNIQYYAYIFEVARRIGITPEMTDRMQIWPTPTGTSERKVISEVARRRSYFHCVGRIRNCMISIWNVSLITNRSGLITTSGKRPCFDTTIEFHCCKRSWDIGDTSVVSGDLENVCVIFKIYHLSFRDRRTHSRVITISGRRLSCWFSVSTEFAQHWSPRVCYKL